MSTVMRRKESEVQLIFKNFRISVMGQCPERAYNERNVFIQLLGKGIKPVSVWANAEEILQMANRLIIQSSGIVLDTGEYYSLSVIQFQYSGIITTGENKPDSDTQHAITIVCDDYIGAFEMSHQDILTLATTLIAQSEFALTANMKFNALIHEKRRFKKLRQKYDVNEIIIKCVDTEPYNYGPGFKEFNISLSYDMTDGFIPKYPHDRNFSYNEVIYFSKFENDFEKDILSITGGSIPYRFVNYDHDEEVRLFNEDLINYDTNATYTTCDHHIPNGFVKYGHNKEVILCNEDLMDYDTNATYTPCDNNVSNAPIHDEDATRLLNLATDMRHDNMAKCYNSQFSNTPIDLSSVSIDSSIDSPIDIVENMISLFNRINSGNSDI